MNRPSTDPQDSTNGPDDEAGPSPGASALAFLAGFGVLRLVLVATILLLIAAAPFAGGRASFESASTIFTTLVAPVFYVVILFVIPLDMTMTRVFMTDKRGAERTRLARVFWTEAVLMAALVLSWLPFLLRLLQYS